MGSDLGERVARGLGPYPKSFGLNSAHTSMPRHCYGLASGETWLGPNYDGGSISTEAPHCSAPRGVVDEGIVHHGYAQVYGPGLAPATLATTGAKAPVPLLLTSATAVILAG